MADLDFSDDEIEHTSLNGDRANSDDDRRAGSDEAEEEPAEKNDGEDESKGRRIDPSTSRKRVTKNPQPKLNAERIQGPKGVHTIEKYFEGFKFYGKGHEKNDLDRVMKRMEHWGHRLFPKYRFDDFLEKMENLGTKKNVQVFLKKYRLGMVEADGDTINDEEDENPVERGNELVPEEAPIDEFDKLIAEQIEKQRQVVSEKITETSNETLSNGNILGVATTSELSDEIKARIEANRKLAIERKMAREKRMEEERKRRKLEESLTNSQEAVTNSQIVENITKGLEKTGGNGQCSGAISGMEEMAVPDSQMTKEIPEELKKDQEKGQCSGENFMVEQSPLPYSQILKEISEELKKKQENEQPSGNHFREEESKLPYSQIMKEISEELKKNQENGERSEDYFREEELAMLNSQICEESADGLDKGGENKERSEGISVPMETSNGNLSDISDSPEESVLINEQMETSTITKAMEETQDVTKRINLPQNQTRISNKPQNNNERLLTNEELLMEISGAVEEIISRGERQRREQRRRNQENARWNGIHKLDSESD